MVFLTKPSCCILGKFTVLYYNYYDYYYCYDDLDIRDSIPCKKSVFFSSPHCYRYRRWVQPA